MLKSTVDINFPFISKITNFSYENGCFPDELKLAEVSPIFKLKDDVIKKIIGLYLFHMSKAFERIMLIQINTFMRDELSKLLTGF